jgi:hypothetical protein
VTLKNSRAGDEAAAVEDVRLAIDVPDAAALDDVDHLFQEILAVDELDEHLLDLFADATTDLPRASRYASALHEYGVAILVKDHARGTADALPFERVPPREAPKGAARGARVPLRLPGSTRNRCKALSTASRPKQKAGDVTRANDADVVAAMNLGDACR